MDKDDQDFNTGTVVGVMNRKVEQSLVNGINNVDIADLMDLVEAQDLQNGADAQEVGETSQDL